MSMKGTGADDLIYTGSSRFQSAQVGLGIPLFYGAQRARIRSAKTNQLFQENNIQIGLKEIENEFSKAQSQYQMTKKTLEYYEEIGLKNANLISTTATKQFSNGEINYLEWVMLMNQSISLQNDYVNALYQFNESVAQLNYLSTK